MNQTEPRPLAAALTGDQFKPTVILFTAPLLMLTWKFFGSTEFYLQQLAPLLGPHDESTAWAAFYHFGSCFVLFAVIPALTVKFVFRERLADYGVRIGNRVLLVRSLLIIVPGIVLVAYLASKSPAMLKEYPINRSAGATPSMFGLHACTYALFYLGWEFYFRGFVQYGLRDKLGTANALGVQVIASTLLHIGKPWGETFGAIAGGILWGILAFRTRSLLSGLVQHFLLGLLLDYFICYT
jgi:membrane protease YdiL (CAAX protease family)